MGILDFFTRKKTEPDFANVRSGSSTTAPPPEPRAPERRVYEVKKGDSLSAIAQKLYGKASLWTKIYEANRDTIKNPDLIYPGQVLTIPYLADEDGRGR